MTAERRPETEGADRLGDLMRRHDPAASRELAPSEAARLRRGVLNAEPETAPAWSPGWAAVAALLLIGLLGGWWLWSGATQPPAAPTAITATEPAPGSVSGPATASPSPEVPTPPAPSLEAASPPRGAGPGALTRPSTRGSAPTLATIPSRADEETTVARELHFETEGGTRLIWIFRPDPPDNPDEGVS